MAAAHMDIGMHSDSEDDLAGSMPTNAGVLSRKENAAPPESILKSTKTKSNTTKNSKASKSKRAPLKEVTHERENIKSSSTEAQSRDTPEDERKPAQRGVLKSAAPKAVADRTQSVTKKATFAEPEIQEGRQRDLDNELEALQAVEASRKEIELLKSRLETAETQYRTLREVGIVEALSNFEKYKKQSEDQSQSRWLLQYVLLC